MPPQPLMAGQRIRPQWHTRTLSVHRRRASCSSSTHRTRPRSTKPQRLQRRQHRRGLHHRRRLRCTVLVAARPCTVVFIPRRRQRRPMHCVGQVCRRCRSCRPAVRRWDRRRCRRLAVACIAALPQRCQCLAQSEATHTLLTAMHAGAGPRRLTSARQRRHSWARPAPVRSLVPSVPRGRRTHTCRTHRRTRNRTRAVVVAAAPTRTRRRQCRRSHTAPQS